MRLSSTVFIQVICMPHVQLGEAIPLILFHIKLPPLTEYF